MKSAAVFEGAQTKTLGISERFFIQFPTIVATTKVLPQPGGPWIIDNRSYKAILTASL